MDPHGLPSPQDQISFASRQDRTIVAGAQSSSAGRKEELLSVVGGRRLGHGDRIEKDLARVQNKLQKF